jgi:hypothetical protein
MSVDWQPIGFGRVTRTGSASGCLSPTGLQWATARRELRLEEEFGAFSDPFPWAEVGAADIERLAQDSALTVADR